MSLHPGTRLGPYEIVAPLGAGGMGEVYRARDTRLDRDVAIKVLPEKLARDSSALARFEREAKAVASLSHPNILAIHDIGESDGVRFAVTELLEGETLRARLDRERLGWRKAVELGIGLTDGVSAAHSRGIVHRDLKPENVIITSSGLVKILDFGLARADSVPAVDVTSSPTAASPTEAGTVLGTVGYMSPEQIGGEIADARSDIFSFGCVLYEMLTGRRAFGGYSPGQTMAAILRDQPPDIHGSGVELPAGLERIVSRCLEKNRDERFQTVRDLGFALREVSGARASVPGRSLPSARRRRFGPAAAIAIVFAGLLLLLLLDPAGWRDRPSSRPGPKIRSLAVLPLQNLSRDPEQDYFADGMTEDLITELAQIRSLRVISRTSIMAYKGTTKTLPEIGRELHVDAVLEGSVQRSGNRVRINAQLVQAATDRNLWAQSYERDLRDVLSLQGDVARAVATRVQAALTPQEEQQLARNRPVDPEAHELFLKGRYYWNRRTQKDVRKSVELFDQAIAKDPGYALAYGGLAEGWITLGFYEGLPPRETFPRAKAAAAKALELDEKLAEAHGSLGMANLFYDWNWAAAESEFRRTLELNPDYPTGHHWYAEFLAAMGRHEESVAEARRAQELEPLSLIINTWVGRQLYFSSRYDDAIVECRKALELDPGFAPAHWQLGAAFVQKARYAEAVKEFEEAVRLTDGSPRYLAGLGHALARAGDSPEARKLWERLRDQSRREYVSSYNFALVALGLGDEKRALEWLEKAYDERSSQICFLGTEPLWDSVRSDPRFLSVLRRVGLASSGGRAEE